LVLPVALLACSCAGDPAPDPAPAKPSLEEIVALGDTDLLAAIEAINQLPDDLEQKLAVEQLVFQGRHGPLPPARCELLERSQTRERCFSLADRPHLGKLRGQSEPPGGARSKATLEEEYDCIGSVGDGGRTPLDEAVGRGFDRVAQEREDPGAPCECLADVDQRKECRFRVAENLVGERGVTSLRMAFELCDFGGPMARDCAGHVTEPVIAALPAGCAVVEDDWKLLFLDGLGFQDGWPCEEGSVTHQRRWARATATAFARAFCLPPEMAAVLPAAAAPHLRAVAAWWAVETAPDPLDLADLRATVGELLAGRRTTDSPSEDPSMLRVKVSPTVYERPPAVPEGVENVVYLQAGFRARGADDGEDLLICLLEAAERQGRSIEPLVTQAGAMDTPALRHTLQGLRERARE